MKKYLPLLLVSLLTLPMATYAATEFYTPIPATGSVTGQLDFDGSTDGGYEAVNVTYTGAPGVSYNGSGGQFEGYFSVGDALFNGNSNPANLFFRFFCIDLYQPATGAVTDYVASQYNSNSAMQKLFDVAYPNESLGDFFDGTSKTSFGAFSTIGTYSAIEYSTAFQLAVWELVYENSGSSFSLDDGKLTDATTGNAHKIANDWLSQVNNYTGSTSQNWQLYSFQSGTNQDFVAARYVPEPGTLLLAGLGLAGLAMTSRRRRNQV